MIVKVLGPGCRNCKNLERVTREALETLGLDAVVEKVRSLTPAALAWAQMPTPRPMSRRY